jgi:hypothetical protein
MLKKILKISGIAFLLLFLIALILPFAFKGKITRLVKEKANQNLNAKLEFSDLDLGLIRSFPNFSIALENLSITGIDEFKGDTLISAGTFKVTTDIMSVISGDQINIKSIQLNQARILAKVLKNGKANWDIAKPVDPKTPAKPEEPSAFKAQLEEYAITNSRIIYTDSTTGIFTRISGLNHSGSGDFTADQTNLETETKIDSIDLSYGGIPYLKKAQLDYTANFFLDLKNSAYQFKENELKINDLLLKFAGKIVMPADDISIDITYEAVKNEVKNFISIIPGYFTKDFDQVKSSGKLGFNGFVKGIYNEKSIPGFAFNLLIENGMVQYPGLPRALKNMQVKTGITCPGGDADKTIIDVSRFHVDLGQFPIDARILIKTPVSDPDIDASVKGNVDLGTVKDLIPLDKGTNLAGLVNADVRFQGRMSSIDAGKYEQFAASGTAGLKRFRYAAPDLPQAIIVSTAAMNFTPKSIQLSNCLITLGKSDIAATGSLENYLGYFLQNKPIKGSLDINSTLLDLNPFMTSDPSATKTPAESTDPAGYIRVPENIDFIVNAAIGTLIYDDMKLTRVSGALAVRNQTVQLQNLIMNALGGTLSMDGVYDTKSAEGPGVSMKLKANQLNIRETAKTFNTVKQLAPIAEKTTGSVSSSLSFSAKADRAFNFIYPTLNGSGSVNTSAIEIEGFELIKKTAESLKLDKLKKWKLEKLAANFVITKGELVIEPFETKIGNYKATIGGTNSLDQKINYVVNIEIPRTEFGGPANSVLTNLTSQASKNGINAELGDIIPVNVKITGTFDKPIVKTDIRSQANDAMNDLKKQAEDKARQELERGRKELESKANAEKERLQKEGMDKLNKEQARLKAEADKAKTEAERKAKEEADKLKKKAEDEAKKGINKLFKTK